MRLKRYTPITPADMQSAVGALRWRHAPRSTITRPLEASHADYRAVLAAVNALGANQRDHSLRLTSVETRLTSVETEISDFRQESRGRFRSVDEQLAEIKDLIISGRNGPLRP